MDRKLYITLKQELTTEHIFQIKNTYGALTVLAEVICFTITLFGLTHTPPFTWKYWVLELFAGLSIFRFLVILHECGHSSLFRQTFLNRIVGYCASVICLHPYESWQYVHHQHHKWVGVVDRDPTVSTLLKLKQSPRLRILFNCLWWTWLPIGFMKYVAEVFWLRAWQGSGINQTGELLKMRFSLGFTIAPHLALIGSFGVVQYLTLFIPMLLVFCFWCESVQIPFHAGLSSFLSQSHPKPIPYADQDQVTRNLKLPSLLRIILGYNFYLHLEHHLFPSAPWYHLPLIQYHLQQLHQVNYTEVELFSHTLKTRSQKAEALFIDPLPSIEA